MCDHFYILWNIILWICDLWSNVKVYKYDEIFCVSYGGNILYDVFVFMWHMEYVALYCIMFDMYVTYGVMHIACFTVRVCLNTQCLYKHTMHVICQLWNLSFIYCKYDYTTKWHVHVNCSSNVFKSQSTCITLYQTCTVWCLMIFVRCLWRCEWYGCWLCMWLMEYVAMFCGMFNDVCV